VPTAILLALALTPAAGGVTKLDAPAQAEWVAVQADPRLTTLAVDSAGVWFLLDDDGAELRPAQDGKTATFTADRDGHYRVVVVCDKQVHRVKVVKASTPPQPMPPGPDPQPKPPEPKPADPLVKVFQAGYDADARPRAEKESDRLDLIELYRQAADLADDAKIETAEALILKVRKAAEALKVAGLLDVRKAVATELQAAFPENVPMTADARKKAADLFARFRACLEQVK
jgi:hypothetical protein